MQNVNENFSLKKKRWISRDTIPTHLYNSHATFENNFLGHRWCANKDLDKNLQTPKLFR